MLIATWKNRLRKLPPDHIPESKELQRELLMPPSSPWPLHFSTRQIFPQNFSPPPLDDRQSQKVDSEQKLSQDVKDDTDEELEQSSLVFGLGDDCTIRRVTMNAIGIDIGTKNIVVSFYHNKKTVFLREINGYYLIPRPSKFIENMLDDPNKMRSDGTKRPAKWIRLDNQDGIYVLGKDAEELAYAHNDTLLRPMAEGGVAPDEAALMVLSSIVQGLLSMAEHDAGEFEPEIKLCYCTTAKALNRPSNIDYHQQVLNLIISGYQTISSIKTSSIKESHALVLKETPDATGIGISWGAGTVTVSYVLWGNEIYSFSWVGAGDWIDTEVAKRHGYDTEVLRKKSAETPTTVCRMKEKIDLTQAYTTRLELDIILHYRILIQNVIRGIVQGFIDNETNARIDKPIDVFMAGGTSCPAGFEEMVSQLFKEEKMPFEVNKVKRCKDPLFAVAEGCLIAASAS